MSARTPRTFWIAMLCIVGLLCVQLSGLHQHRHVDLHDDDGTHAVQLHFEDVGWHGDEHATEHRHGNTADASHPHLDVETKVVDDGLAKVFSLMLSVVGLVWCLLLWPRLGAGVPRPAQPPLRRRPSCFDGRPPSQAPPLLPSHIS